MPDQKPTIFISYSHKDTEWKDRLLRHLNTLKKRAVNDPWSDDQINPGDDWYDQINAAMQRASVAVCLISADFLTSDFCQQEEIPYLLERRENDGLLLIPVLLRPCLWDEYPWLKAIQMHPKDGKSVAREYRDDWDTVFVALTTQIRDFLAHRKKPTPPAPAWTAITNDDVSIERLPQTGMELFGRRKEIKLLNSAWHAAQTNVVSFVAYGGVGKSTLVNKWLSQMEADNWRGAKSVFGWSFYSQGTGERVTSADQFIDQALRWFGDDAPQKGSPFDKGRRLAKLVQKEKTLLILDGLEPLQGYRAEEKGRIKDAALSTLLRELARKNTGLCLVTTREPVTELHRFTNTVVEHSLETISPEAGRALLRVRGIRGSNSALEQATQDFGCHALAINLLSAWLYECSGHHISQAQHIPDLDIPKEKGRHPRRLMAVREQQLANTAELNILNILGLFDRPADKAAIDAITAPPTIDGLTHQLQQISDGDWQRALTHLRVMGLLAKESTHAKGQLDAHPLVREHFGELLEKQNNNAFKEGHRRLYEHLKTTAKELPDTLEELAHLYVAVHHGCKAGVHQAALEEVYWSRIRRENKGYSVHQLGAFGADLAALSGFFAEPWTAPVPDLTQKYQAAVLGWAGFELRALGRLTEAADPMEAGLAARIGREDWTNAARAAGNLSQLHLCRGDLAQAVAYGKESVAHADRSGDAFQRMSKRTALADALHHAGQIKDARDAFVEAEKMQAEQEPHNPMLYSLQGYQYCDLLLSQGEAGAVRERAQYAIKISKRKNWLLTIALDHLSMGRAALTLAGKAGNGDFTEAQSQLHTAVDRLRQAGAQEFIVRGLLARAALFREMERWADAHADLTEALEIAQQGGMKLHEADAHLEFTRLFLAQGKWNEANTHFTTAQQMVNELNYGRRFDEVKALKAQIKPTKRVTP